MIRRGQGIGRKKRVRIKRLKYTIYILWLYLSNYRIISFLGNAEEVEDLQYQLIHLRVGGTLMSLTANLQRDFWKWAMWDELMQEIRRRI